MYIENRRIVLSNLRMNTSSDSSVFKVFKLASKFEVGSNSSYGFPTFIKIKAMQPYSTWDFVYEFDVIDIQHLYSQISQHKMWVLAGFFACGLVFISWIPSSDGRSRYLYMSLHDV